MSIDLLLKEARTQSKLIIPANWGQGRATFGGLIGSLMLSRLTAELGELAKDRVLRSATISFIGAVTQGEVEISTEIFRSGKSVTQAAAKFIQNGEVMALLLASFGSPRESGIHVTPRSIAPEYKAPVDAVRLPYIPNLTPEFMQQVDLRWAQGDAPFSGSNKADFGGWMRWVDAFPCMTISHLLGLTDSWPPSVLPMLKGHGNASTLSWNIEFFSHEFQKTSEHWWQYQVTTDFAESGYAHAEAHIWDDDKNLVAISRQVSTIFA
ncbi:thioesterase family protein [Undibacterium sp. Ji67W]